MVYRTSLVANPRSQAPNFLPVLSEFVVYGNNRGMSDMKAEYGAVRTFRLNFRDALQCDGRSLSAFSRDINTSASYLSRIRSGSSYTDSGKPIIPGLDACERIAQGLGYPLTDMVKPVNEFRAILRLRYPDFQPTRKRETRGRPAPQEHLGSSKPRRKKSPIA